MPRPPEATPLRRILEQAIMWLVLAATVGAAAWVSSEVNELGTPQAFDGITIQLPKRWDPTEDHDGETALEVRERGDPRLARTISVRRASLSIRSLLRGPPKRTEQVTLADGVPARISVVSQRIASEPGVGSIYDLEVVAVLTPPGGPALTVSVKQVSFDEKSDAKQNIDLIKRVLETVRFSGAS